jgi:hypothetical protein
MAEPVVPLSNEHGSQVKDQGRRQCCHNKSKKIRYRPTRDVSLLSGHSSYVASRTERAASNLAIRELRSFVPSAAIVELTYRDIADAIESTEAVRAAEAATCCGSSC